MCVLSDMDLSPSGAAVYRAHAGLWVCVFVHECKAAGRKPEEIGLDCGVGQGIDLRR